MIIGLVECTSVSPVIIRPPMTTLSLAALALMTQSAPPAPAGAVHRAPSVPLVAHDPYFSVWSPADKLADRSTVHWTGKEHPLTAMIRVDGKTLRLLGTEAGIPALPQTGTEITPTRTITTFAGEGVSVRMTFTTPTLPNDLDVLARPATYVTWDVAAIDGKSHRAALYFDAGAELATNVPTQQVEFRRQKVGNLTALSVGTVEQPVLAKRGDDLRIDWGHLYLSATGATGFMGNGQASRLAFSISESLRDDAQTGPADDEVIAFDLPLGRVGAKPVTRHLTIAYDDGYSIEYFGQKLRPYWRRNGMDAAGLLRAAESQYGSLVKRCEAFDKEITADMTKAGGENYAYLGSLAYRQAFAAQKLVADPNGKPLLFSKENFSNGCIGTIDLIYPAAPLTLLFSPALTRASLEPVLAYSTSGRWKFPFAPHDLGTYPKANGQVYGGGERTEENQMPVEETGNMLIVLAALAQTEGNAEFSRPYWPLLKRWAAYLADKGFDPESQLSTDDFAGHLAHNVNLSVKAIEALGAYAQLAKRLGDDEESNKYRKIAEEFATRWVKEAEDGGTTRLAFDKPGTWAQKYNLVWDRPLGINLFPATIAEREVAFYRTKLNPYGLPLDSRADYTKLDWTVWSATLTGKREDFDALIAPTIAFLNSTEQRIPMTDWHDTSRPRHVGFQARSVVGGVFIKLLDDPATWRKWVARDRSRPTGYAPIPERPVFNEVTPNARTQALNWRYRFDAPTGNWFAADYDDSSWSEGPGGFGTAGTPGSTVRTKWDGSEIWLRRTFDLPAMQNPRLWIHHDEDAEVYVNGVLAAKLGGFLGDYDAVELLPAARQALKVGKNVVAIKVSQTGGGQFIDLGFVEFVPPKSAPKK